MKKAFVIAAFFALSASSTSFAKAQWYTGVVSRVAMYGDYGEFIVTFSNSALDDCKHRYVYFRHANLGEGRLKQAFSLATASLMSKRRFGVVIDKAINGAGGYCNQQGMGPELR